MSFKQKQLVNTSKHQGNNIKCQCVQGNNLDVWPADWTKPRRRAAEYTSSALVTTSWCHSLPSSVRNTNKQTNHGTEHVNKYFGGKGHDRGGEMYCDFALFFFPEVWLQICACFLKGLLQPLPCFCLRPGTLLGSRLRNHSTFSQTVLLGD